MDEPRRTPGGFPVVGIIGDGQLARMCATPAAELGVSLSVLCSGPDSPAGQVIVSSPIGDYRDVETVLRFASQCDVVTFDHEHVPPTVLEAMMAAGVRLAPSPRALRYAQDKLDMRERLGAIGISCPLWARACTADDVMSFGTATGWPIVAKVPRGGYDGNGVRIVHRPEQLHDWLALVAEHALTTGRFADGVLLEEKVDFVRELAVLVARSPSGQAAAWPVVETVQRDGICTEVLAPAPGLDPVLAGVATEAALRIAGGLEVTGVLAVEMFEVRNPGTGDPDYLVNELAMRPHNSGHWSMDGAVTGQFEQHLRAVLDLPLGSPAAVSPVTAMANVLGGDHGDLYRAYRHVMARDPGVKVHMYGKSIRPGRKIGHVNVLGDNVDDARARATHAADYLRGVITE